MAGRVLSLLLFTMATSGSKKQFIQQKDDYSLRTSVDYRDLSKREWRDVFAVASSLMSSPRASPLLYRHLNILFHLYY